MELNEILERIQRRLEAVGLSEAQASALAKKPDGIRNLRRAIEKNNGRQGISTATLNALAPVLKTTPAWLFAGAGPEEAGVANTTHPVGSSVEASELSRHARPTEVVESVSPLVVAIYGGFVEAGTFREVDEFSDLPPPRVSAVRDKEFPFAPLLVFDVRGDSMNALSPVPITDGSQITAIEFESLNGRIVPYAGMTVVVERTRDGGHLRELSVKQLEIFEDRWEYHPRSTNDRHKPIVVPHDMDPNDGTTVRILAWVRKIMHDVS